jgi:hypothetical protein
MISGIAENSGSVTGTKIASSASDDPGDADTLIHIVEKADKCQLIAAPHSFVLKFD